MIKTRYGLPLAAIKKINTIFLSCPKIKQVILYGSRAMGSEKPGSDIDLCVDANELTLTELLTIETRLDDLLLPWKIDLSLKNRIDNLDLLQHINKKGVIFYP